MAARTAARATAAKYWPQRGPKLGGLNGKERGLRDKCRKIVIGRDRQCCRACLEWIPLDQCQVHEHPPRSLGGDPFAPEECVLLCRECHTGTFGIHGMGLPKLTMEFVNDFAKAFGPVKFRKGLAQWISAPPDAA